MSSVENLDDTGTNEFLVSFVVNIFLGTVFLIAFSFCRRRIPYFFDSRRVDHVRNPAYRPGQLYLERPPRQSRSFFGWIPQILQMSERGVMKTAGVDAVITLRFFLWMALYLTVYTIIGFAIIIPIQATSDAVEISGFNSLSIMALGKNDGRLYCHLVVMYIFTAVLFVALRQMWFDNIKLKSKWLSNEQLSGRKLTILLDEIPEEYQKDERLFAFFEELYPGKVVGASIIKKMPQMIELYEEREKLVNEVNHAKGIIELDIDDDTLETYHRLQRDGLELTEENGIDARALQILRPRKKLGCLGCCGEEVDLFEYNARRIAEIEEIMYTIFQQRDDLPTYSTGFVTFDNAVTAASVIDVPIGQVTEFKARWAPEVNDLLWFGLQKPALYKLIMTIIMAVIHFLIVFFYMVPVGFVSSLMTLQSLSQRLPFLEPVLTFHPVIKGFLEGFLPSLAMVIFMALLPLILRIMGQLKGLESASWVQQYVFRKYYVFQLFNFFLITAVSSSVLNQIDEIIKNPTSIPELLARSLPQSAGLFVNYIMLRAFSNNLNLFDIDLVITFIKAFFARTPKAYVEAFKPAPFKFGKEFPESILILVIAFCFGTIQPVILPFAAIYFFTLYLRNKYRFVYMAVTPYESGGGFWPLAFNRIVFGVIISQLTILGIFALKENYVTAGLMVPLPLFSIWYWYIYYDLYTSTGHRLTLLDSALTDKTHDSLTDEQRTALSDGHNLPLPLHVSILPFIMPDRVADTPFRENYINRELKKQAESGSSSEGGEQPLQSTQAVASSPSPTPTPTSSHEDVAAVAPTGGIQIATAADSSASQQPIQTLEQETMLSEQYFGDDLELQQHFRQFVKTCQLDPSTPADSVYDEYKRLYFEELDRTGASHSQPQTPMSALGRSDDSEDDIEGQIQHKFTPPIDHRILIEKAVLRWRQSQRQQQKLSQAQEEVNKALAASAPATSPVVVTAASPGGDNADAAVVQDLTVPSIRSPSVSISETHIVPKEFSFAQTRRSSALSPNQPGQPGSYQALSDTTQPIISGIEPLQIEEVQDESELGIPPVTTAPAAPTIVVSPGSSQQQDAPAPAATNRRRRSRSMSGISGPIVVSEERVERMTSAMRRYYQPQFNETMYSSIQDIVWGSTYLSYYRKSKGRSK